MVSKQIVLSSKLLVCAASVLFICFGYVVMENDTVRFWLQLLSVGLILRWISLLIAYDFVIPFLFRRKRIKPLKKAVLITGCDSGFGNLLAKRLSDIGFHVFAGCLYPLGAGAKELRKSRYENIRAFGLDVTQDQSVEEAREFIRNNLGEFELWAVVNNAGITGDTFIELTPMKSFEAIINVNLMGPIRVTKAFLPFIRQAKGRIVNVTSVAAKIPVPTSAAYSISKCGLTMFSEALRIETSKFDVPVVTIEPWFYSTYLSDVGMRVDYMERVFAQAPPEAQESYNLESVRRIYNNEVRLKPFVTLTNLVEVVKDMECAIMEKVPQYAYYPGRWYYKLLIWYLTSIPLPIRDFLVTKGLWGNFGLK